MLPCWVLFFFSFREFVLFFFSVLFCFVFCFAFFLFALKNVSFFFSSFLFHFFLLKEYKISFHRLELMSVLTSLLYLYLSSFKILRNCVIEWLLLNVQQTVFQLYSFTKYTTMKEGCDKRRLTPLENDGVGLL
jgi:hypothetical protein